MQWLTERQTENVKEEGNLEPLWYLTQVRQVGVRLKLNVVSRSGKRRWMCEYFDMRPCLLSSRCGYKHRIRKRKTVRTRLTNHFPLDNQETFRFICTVRKMIQCSTICSVLVSGIRHFKKVCLEVMQSTTAHKNNDYKALCVSRRSCWNQIKWHHILTVSIYGTWHHAKTWKSPSNDRVLF